MPAAGYLSNKNTLSIRQMKPVVKSSWLSFLKITTAQALLLGYLTMIVAGGILLMLPVSLEAENTISFLDAVFTSASAISGAGLTVVDTGSFFSYFGITVILVLIQIGNIGYMLFFALAVILFKRRLSLANKMMIKESISISQLGLALFIKKVFKYTLIIEGIAAFFLTLFWLQEYPLLKALGLGIFFSVSSFCTAGFSVFGDSISGYSHNWYVSSVIMITSYLGACGFFVLYDMSQFFRYKLQKKPDRYRLSTHTKLVLVVSLSLMMGGGLFIFISENLLHPSGYQESFLESLFQSVSASTSVGLTSTSIPDYNFSSLLILMMLMFIGGSPSGTGGGIKTTVFAITVASLYTFLADRKQLAFFKRSISTKAIARASAISFLAFGWFFLTLLILSFSDPDIPVFSLAFESVSAIACNGISTGITPQLSDVSKFTIIISVLIGRVGPLIVGYSLIGRTEKIDYEYPQGHILIV